jgi:hypothetical protein
VGANEFTAVAGGVAAVLGVVGGMLRYLIRLAASMERTSTQAAAMGEAFGRHVESSDELHRALTDRVSLHGEQLAAILARQRR